MASSITKITIFLASPGDVARERNIVSSIAKEISDNHGRADGYVLEVVRWETHARPAMGRGQEVINKQLGPTDIFIGIMGHKFGSPTGKADSGTEEEFNNFVKLHRRLRKNKPDISFYFKDAPMRNTDARALEQKGLVNAFQKRLQRVMLYWTYTTLKEFETQVRSHLTAAVRGVLEKDVAGGRKATNDASREKQNSIEPKKTKGKPRTTKGSIRKKSAKVIKTKSPRKLKTSHLRTPKAPRVFTITDKKRYLSSALTMAKKIFRVKVADLNKQPGIQAKATIQTNGSLLIEVLSGGQLKHAALLRKTEANAHRAAIMLQQGTHLGNQTNNHFGGFGGGNGDSIHLLEQNGKLQLSTGQHFYNDPNTIKTPSQAAAWLWHKFSDRLERGW